MRIPLHWSKATAERVDEHGKKHSASAWRSSDVSAEDAQASALDAARRILKNFTSGAQQQRYAYGDRVLREEVIERIVGPRGELIGAVTQNSYGAFVLNTAQVMFIDLDFSPIMPSEEVRYFFTKWFNRSARSPTAQREYDTLARVKSFLNDRPQWGVRVYRTCNGLRVLVTHALFDPVSADTQALFQLLGTDPMYMRLCQVQESFRARLTPKAWRCGHTDPLVTWPRETDDEKQQFAKWSAAYKQLQAGFATCRFLGEWGTAIVHPGIEPIVELHDRWTRCNEPLELA